jgi:hypothetical protein
LNIISPVDIVLVGVDDVKVIVLVPTVVKLSIVCPGIVVVSSVGLIPVVV